MNIKQLSGLRESQMDASRLQTQTAAVDAGGIVRMLGKTVLWIAMVITWCVCDGSGILDEAIKAKGANPGFRLALILFLLCIHFVSALWAIRFFRGARSAIWVAKSALPTEGRMDQWADKRGRHAYGVIAAMFLGMINAGLLNDALQGLLTFGSLAIGLWVNTVGFFGLIISGTGSLHALEIFLSLVLPALRHCLWR